MESVSESIREKKVAIVTGAARGLGLLTARKLPTRGYQVVLTARDREAGRRAVTEIRTAVPGAQLECLELETSSLQSVRAFAGAFQALGLPLHLMNCAERRSSDDSYDRGKAERWWRTAS